MVLARPSWIITRFHCTMWTVLKGFHRSIGYPPQLWRARLYHFLYDYSQFSSKDCSMIELQLDCTPKALQETYWRWNSSFKCCTCIVQQVQINQKNSKYIIYTNKHLLSVQTLQHDTSTEINSMRLHLYKLPIYLGEQLVKRFWAKNEIWELIKKLS
jgi:hypothetical protein